MTEAPFPRDDDLEAAAAVKKRACHDKWYILYFLLVLTGMVGMAYWALAMEGADIARLLHPADFSGRTCGKGAGVEDKPFLYVCGLASEGYQDGFPKKLDFWSKTCISECPSNNRSDVECIGRPYVLPRAKDCTTDDCIDQANQVQVRRSVTWEVAQAITYQKTYATEPFRGTICAPSWAAPNDLRWQVINGPRSPISSIGEAVGSLETAWPILLAVFVIATVLSMVFLRLMSFYAGLVLFVSLGLGALLTFLAGLWFSIGVFFDPFDQEGWYQLWNPIIRSVYGEWARVLTLFAGLLLVAIGLLLFRAWLHSQERLSAHHSCPLYREAQRRPMGKAGKWAKQWPDKHAEQDYGWQDYSAYYKDAPARQPRRPREPQGPSFPQYDAMVIREPRNGKPENPPPAGPPSAGAGDFLRTVQKLTNNLRRAELRLRKCSEEQHQVNEKWECFQKELKQSFMKEWSRYREYSTKLQGDQEDAKQHQSAAIEEVYKFLADPTQYKSTPTPDAPPKEAVEEWERLMRGAAAEGDDGLSGLLAGALGGAGAREQATKHMLEVLNAHRHGQQRERERTPPRRTAEALQMTPPAPTGHPRSHLVLPPDVGLENPDVAMRPKDEPYMSSPGSRHLLPSPGQRARTAHPRTPLKAQGRQPLQAPSTASSSLAAKLEASREALRSEIPETEEEKADGEDQIIGSLRAASGPPDHIEID
ncbi:unnamed protein product [Symbiodinium sp. CCMP2592]|nr:unnamed protein product [Symbiodinium sp. CCMP2592]